MSFNSNRKKHFMKINPQLIATAHNWFDLCYVNDLTGATVHPYLDPSLHTISVYILLHVQTQSFYVGSCINAAKRFCNHRHFLFMEKHANKRLQECYQNSVHTKAIVFPLKDRETAYNFEQEFINENRNNPRLLNWGMDVKRPMLGMSLSPETRGKISEAFKGRILSDEHREKISKSKLGVETPAIVRERIRQAMMGQKPSEETKKKMSLSRVGKKHSEETKKIMSKIAIETNRKPSTQCIQARLSEESRKKIGLSKLGNAYCLGRKHSTFSREKMSIARKAVPLSESSLHHIRELSSLKQKPILVDGVTYVSLTDCSKKLNISKSTILNRLKNNNFINWQYV